MQQYLAVNWTDGMKINKSHFIAQDDAHASQLAAGMGSLLSDVDYGLLPQPHTTTADVKLFLSIDNQQQVQLRVLQCRAITRGGYYIQLDNAAVYGQNLSAPVVQLSVPFQELKGKATTFYVIITINPFQRVPFGAADADEYPPRLPYVMPAYNLSLLPEGELAQNKIGLFQMPIGRVRLEEQKLLLDESYIPPCRCISSHYHLLDVYAGFEQFYATMEQYALQIIQKILQRKQTNEMAGIVQKLCENITLYTALHLAEIKTTSLQQPPVCLINKAGSLARLFKNTLDYYMGSGKEELLNYCMEWCDVSQGELEGCITELANHQYDHLDINAGIIKATRFSKILATLFANLARLEYIGKRKDAGIFVKEIIVSREPEPVLKQRRSFLAD